VTSICANREEINHVDHLVGSARPDRGFIGSKLVNKTGEGFFFDIALGIVGAVVGGGLFSLFGMHGVTGLNIYSLIVAVVGAVVLLVVYHAIRRRAA
jgi:uncharacterized membrane protein YeaQ/YmgE (transglycosylase-associated protein family)